MSEIKGPYPLIETITQWPELKTYFASYGSFFYRTLHKEQYFKYQKKIKCFVLFDKEKIIGWSWVMPDKNHEKRVTDFMIFVHPSYRKQGYGTELITHTTKTSRDKRAHRVFKYDSTSREFFKKLKHNDNSKLMGIYYGCP